MYNRYKENLWVIGKNLDLTEDNAGTLLEEVFPDTSDNLLEAYETTYDLNKTGNTVERRNRILMAMRRRGGLSKTYFENMGNLLGLGYYTVVVTEGTGNLPFVIHDYSPISSPSGPATLLPGRLYDPPYTDTPYDIVVTVTGVAGPEAELETLFSRLKPAWTTMSFVYVP
jgi:uncharacterized protein YmfQ (DUF2313 family)